jgi:alpha-beta hydrolase superfamily lysophospholipase
LQRTTHKRVKRNRIGRDEYRCQGCEARTYPCRICDNMARGHLDDLPSGRAARLWASRNDELCAEHDGSIVSFETADTRLADLADYELLLSRSKLNLRQVGKIAGLAVGGALLLGAATRLAAPRIAAALGAGGLLGTARKGTKIVSLRGAALTRAALAAIGGRFGMPGGAVFLAGAGAALGAGEGALVGKAFFGQIEGFRIHKVRSGVGPAVIVIDGFLSQDQDTTAHWVKGIAAQYGKNPMYKVEWESKRLAQLGKLAAEAGATFIARQVAKGLAGKAAKPTVPVLGPLGAGLRLARNPWHVAMFKASMTGILLAELLARTDHKDGFIILGHSLGARVAYYTLKTLSTLDHPVVQQAYLLGGAVGRGGTKDWLAASKSVAGRIYNAYSDNDDVLKYLYPLGAASVGVPVGLGAIEVEGCEKIQNLDVSDLVDGHFCYKRKLSVLLDRFHS